MDHFGKLGAKLVRRFDFRRLGALTLLTLGSFSVWSALTPRGDGQVAADYNSAFLSAADTQNLPRISMDGSSSARAIYPYSVIPGGVESAAELRNSITHDAVVAEHYQGFAVERARVVRLSEDRALYVSYRLGNRVFWSKKRFTLLKGETVITDGEHMVRTRCGNRVAEAPAGPVLAAEPTFEAEPAEVAQTLAGGPGLLGAPFAPGDVPLIPPPVSGIPPASGSPGGGIFFPPGTPIVGGGPPSHGTPPILPIVPPPVTTPEPGTLFMLATGLTGLWFGRKKWKS
jgi:PEP-CTERM motif